MKVRKGAVDPQSSSCGRCRHLGSFKFCLNKKYIYIYIFDIPQKWTFGDAQLEFPGRIKLGIILLKKKMNITRSLLEDIKTKQLKWYGHVQRMEEGRLPKKVMKWSPPGRRKRGRPKITWAEGI